MTELILLVGLSLGTCTITGYRSVPSQTDDSPNWTSIGERTHKGGAAVSRDLLQRWGGPCQYGDYIYIENMGVYQINDCMGATKYDRTTRKRLRITHSVDIWVGTLSEEHRINVQTQKVYLITRKLK